MRSRPAPFPAGQPAHRPGSCGQPTYRVPYRPIRLAVVDDHPALRGGLRAIAAVAPELLFVGDSDGDPASVRSLVERTRPDVVLLDYQLPHGDGLQLCVEIKRASEPPKVAVYSAFATSELALPAAIAGADALVHKGVEARELIDVLLHVQRGDAGIAPPAPDVLRRGLEVLDVADRPIVGMLLDGATEAEVSDALALRPEEVDQAVRRVVAQLGVHPPQAPA